MTKERKIISWDRTHDEILRNAKEIKWLSGYLGKSNISQYSIDGITRAYYDKRFTFAPDSCICRPIKKSQ